MKKTHTTEEVLELIERKRTRSEIVPPINKRIVYKGQPGLLLNNYGNGLAYFKLDGDETISCDKETEIRII